MRAFDIFIPAAVRAVRDSLDQEPDAWSPYYIGDYLYRLTHTSGLKLWTQNRPYGLEIYAPNGTSLYGGVTFLSSLRLSPGRWSLLFAIWRWEAKHPLPAKPAKPALSVEQILRGEQVQS